MKQLGDPTKYGIIKPCPAVVSAITKAIQSPGISAGYVNACGTHEARAAIASYHSKQSSEIMNVIPEDIIIANGASGALELALTALLDEDSVLLVPRPGFPLYQVIAESHGARVVHYDLLPQSGWECDLNHMESIILHEEEEAMRKNWGKKHDAKNRAVRAILINNPSNPTGAVYSESHLMDIIRVAARHRLPIISDEIYGDMTFGNNSFHPMASVSVKLGNQVPIITASGLGKQCELKLMSQYKSYNASMLKCRILLLLVVHKILYRGGDLGGSCSGMSLCCPWFATCVS